MAKMQKYISDIGGQFVDHVEYFIDKQQLTQYLINNLVANDKVLVKGSEEINLKKL